MTPGEQDDGDRTHVERYTQGICNALALNDPTQSMQWQYTGNYNR